MADMEADKPRGAVLYEGGYVRLRQSRLNDFLVYQDYDIDIENPQESLIARIAIGIHQTRGLPEFTISVLPHSDTLPALQTLYEALYAAETSIRAERRARGHG
jgi:hypothetical protein